jgi:hypothetical protein
MSEANNAELQDALRYRDDIKAAFDRLVEDAEPEVQKHAVAVGRGEGTAGMPPEAREATAQLLNGRGYIEDAEAQVARIIGHPAAAEYHEAQRDDFWRLRDEIRARR